MAVDHIPDHVLHPVAGRLHSGDECGTLNDVELVAIGDDLLDVGARQVPVDERVVERPADEAKTFEALVGLAVRPGLERGSMLVPYAFREQLATVLGADGVAQVEVQPA